MDVECNTHRCYDAAVDELPPIRSINLLMKQVVLIATLLERKSNLDKQVAVRGKYYVQPVGRCSLQTIDTTHGVARAGTRLTDEVKGTKSRRPNEP